MPDLRPYDPTRTPAPQWEGDLRLIQYGVKMDIEAVYPDGKPFLSGAILRLSREGLWRYTGVNPALGFHLDAEGRIVDATPATPVVSPPPNPALTPPPGAVAAIWLGPEQQGCNKVPHLFRNEVDGSWVLDRLNLSSDFMRCRPILNPEVLR